MSESFSLGLAHKLELAWRKEGGTSADLNSFSENPEEIRAMLARLRGQSASSQTTVLVNPSTPPPVPPLTFATWRTVEIGRYGSHAACVAALKSKKRKTATYAAEILPRVQFATERRMIDVVRTTPRGLGFTEGTPRHDTFISDAKKHGLVYCPAEVGPALREDYKDQPMNEWLTVMMEPLEDSDGGLCMFFVGRNDDGQWLNTVYGNPDYEFHLDREFLLARSK